ncbi:hypothetical protein NFI96_000656 [Prochilodus magdalenae]|nr:hypothetical protein NFI96_000656 [Prochilodus magdalenae]
MHDTFIQENDPRTRLEQSRDMYCRDFKDLFHERDQCQKKAQDFANRCLMPAVEAYLSKALGLEIVDEIMKEKNHFKTRTFFHEFVLKELLKESNVSQYLLYILCYDSFFRLKILAEIVNCLIIENKLAELEKQLFVKITKDITRSISKVDTQKPSNIKDFIFTVCKDLEDTLVIPVDSIEELVSLNKANVEQFAVWLRKSVEEMKILLQQKIEEQTLKEKIENLHFKPVEALEQQLIGCGEQCPFCGAPCEATGAEHTEHFATIHRPQGLLSFKSNLTEKLVTDICTTSVFSEKLFICEKTGNKPHPYKRYREIYPDWRIPPDTTEASNYWKYVMVQFNEQFANLYETQPADIPPAWRQITKEQAESSLKKSFGGE